MANLLRKLFLIGILVFFVAMVSTPSVYASTWTNNLNNGLIHYFTFDENTSTVVNDSLGLMNLNGSNCEGDEWIGGILGSAVDLDADDVYFSDNIHSTLPDIDDTKTINFWFIDDDSDGYLLSMWNENADDKELSIHVNNFQDGSFSPVFGVINNDDWVYSNDLSTIVTDETDWNMGTIIQNNSKDFYFYVNGNFSSNKSLGDIGDFDIVHFMIGYRLNLYNHYEGYIDELGIWNRSLSPAEISQLYNNGMGITYSSSTNNIPIISLNNPPNASTNQEISVELNISVNDSDGEAMNVTFYNETWSQIYQKLNVASGSVVNYTWSELNYSTTYTWNVNVSDGQNTTSKQYLFTTKPSLSLTLNSPANTSTVNALETTLNFTIYDLRNRTINYTIYNGTFSILKEDTSQLNGTTIIYDWTGLSYNTKYIWYVNLTTNQEVILYEYTFTTYPDTFAPSITSQYPETATTDLSLDMRVVTNEISTCRWSSTPNTAFGSMTNNFSTTNNLTHTYSLSGLSLGMYTYYVRCQDALGNNMTSDYNLTFEVINQKSSGTSGGVTPLFILNEEENTTTIDEVEVIQQEKKNNAFIIIASAVIIGGGVIAIIIISSIKRKPKFKYGFKF